MSTILDALKKVERERESPSDRLRHEPEHAPKRARRVSTVTIVVCAILGFAAGAGIALWRSAGPVADEAEPAAAAPPTGTEVAVASADPAPRDVPAARPQPENDTALENDAAAVPATDATALEPSPFEPPPAELEPPVNAAVPVLPEEAAAAGAPEPAGAAPEIVAALPRPAPRPLELSPGTGDANEPGAGEDVPLDDESEAGPELEETAPPAEETVIDTGRSPPGAPRVTLSFLQWSADPARRFAFISVDGGPSQRVREGDAAGAVTVARITPDGVRIRHADTLFIIRPRH